MSIDNEELMHELQRVSVMMRRSRRAHVKNRDGEAGGHDHSHGNHKCHGGSGRHGQNRILAALSLQDGISQKDLAYLLGIRPQSLTQALESLEKDECIQRVADTDDKRISRVTLTEKGGGRAKKVAEDRKRYAEDAFGMLSEQEKEQLASILDKIGSHMDSDLSEKGTRKKA